nr:immunoglobulin heavy chain junction region [Mus musculus]MBK4197152.1 immunoglobulin heavy chain junction region [Mus musculus]MBK4197155.1 immunoglobulin heavy chain junction region [Mus musculus]
CARSFITTVVAPTYFDYW